MDGEIEQINVEPEFPFNPFEECEADSSPQKINSETDALNLFTFTKSRKKQQTENSNTKKCIYCDKFYRKKYMATHLRVRNWLKKKCVVELTEFFSFFQSENLRPTPEKNL